VKAFEQICRECSAGFTVPPEESAFLQRLSPRIAGRCEGLPQPDLCPGCREQRRLAFRNEWNMYRRRCDFSGRELIAIYHAGSPYKVFDPAVWWSDDFDPLQYGRAFDFSRPFFEQFHELNLEVPKAAIQNAKSENSAFTNYSAENRNCYLCVGSAVNEDCYYCSRVFNSRQVCDSFDLQRCESCYECLHGSDLYGCVFCSNCHNSSDLAYCEDCRGCRDCLGSAGLRNRSFCLFNRELGEKEYRREAAELRAAIARGAGAPPAVKAERDDYNINCEESSGAQLLGCSRCRSCFMLKESQDCRYVGSGTDNRDCCDCNFMDNSELLYFSTNLRHNYRVLFGALVWYSSEALYALNCFNSSNLFGCSGMKRSSYCILNKQYDSEQYGRMVLRIIGHMRETGEWGRYFPARLSPFPYNCSVAAEYYPLPRDEALNKGLSWHEAEGAAEHTAPGAAQCAATGKAFKIMEQERELCARLGVPLPATCPAVRHNARMSRVKRAMSEYAGSSAA